MESNLTKSTEVQKIFVENFPQSKEKLRKAMG